MLVWLVPIAVFWSLAALYVGGAAINIEGGGGGRQTLGLLLLFASYLGVYAVSGMVLAGVAGAAFGVIVFPLLIASIAPTHDVPTCHAVAAHASQRARSETPLTTHTQLFALMMSADER